MAVGFRGGSSLGGSRGINFDSDYFKVAPSPLGELLTTAQKASMGYDGGGSGSGSTGPLGGYDPVSGIADYALYQGVDPYLGNFSGESGQKPDYFTKEGKLTKEDKANYLDAIGGFVYNPKTKEFEVGDYLLDKIAPEYSDYYDTMLLGLNNPNLTADKLQDIEKNRINVQKGILDITKNNPGANAQDIIDSYNESFTGFDSSGNFTDPEFTDPFNTQVTFDQFHNQNMQNNPDVHQGSVFDEGGIFSGSFWANKGGKVPASNGGK